MRRVEELATTWEQPWGKFDGDTGTRHHLAHHCADVASCFRALCQQQAIRNRLTHAAGQPLSDAVLERLVVLVFLHDAGKLHPGFQAKAWPPGLWSEGRIGHVKEGLEIFVTTGAGGESLSPAVPLQIEALISWQLQTGLLRAVISHHGRPAPAPADFNKAVVKRWQPVGDYDPGKAAREMGAAMQNWFPLAFSDAEGSFPDHPRFEHLICGLTALADWIGSDANRFTHVQALDPGYIERADDAARAALVDFGIDATHQRAVRSARATFTEITSYGLPNAQQALVEDVSTECTLVILEAETGSGKTESALWRYIRLFEAGKVDGLYFAVPTRAAAVQLHERIVRAAKRVFGEASPEPILAVPGYLRAGSADGKPLPHWRVLWDDEAETSEQQRAKRWAAEHTKRYLAAQIAVGTVDQAMLGALKVKHAHLRASSLSRSLLVIDEVHASDRFMTEIQQSLLETQLGLGGYAFLMSATLGSRARCKWLGQASTDFETAVATPYPAVWMAGVDQPLSTDEEGRAASGQKSVRTRSIQTMAPEAAADAAIEAAVAGARVLIIRNTVDRAVETLSAVEQSLGTAASQLLFAVNGVSTLHHSRFAPSDRKLLDKAVESALSTSCDRAAGGKIVVGTQTLEQSLDIDADILITDLCPIDVLLQRIGRLHRHKLPRPPGFHEPQCVVLEPEGGLERLVDPPKFENGLGGWESHGGIAGVYRELSVLELTRRLIIEHEIWDIPRMNRALVEGGTHEDKIADLHEELGDAWRRYDAKVGGAGAADAVTARGMILDWQVPFDDVNFSDDERIATRLGDQSVQFTLAEPHPQGPFGETVCGLNLPAHWIHERPVDDEPLNWTQTDDGIIVSIADADFYYDRFGILMVP